jgi:hypothetical protein
MAMRRSRIYLLLLATAVTTAVGCGFGRADDTGLPIPGQYWGWVCPSGDRPDGDAGCPSADGGTSPDSGAFYDGGADALPSLQLRRL